MEEAGQTPHGDNTAVSMLEAEGGTLRVVFRDDNSHLQTPEFLAGEKVRKRANALEPGLWFRPLRLEEQADWFAETVSSAWRETGNIRPFGREKLLTDAAQRTTLVGYLGEDPVGLVQVGPEPGLWFRPLEMEEQADWFAELVSSVWRDTRPFDREKLLADASHRTTLVGYLGEEAVGLIQVGPEPGWISLACIREDCRKRGFGVQLIGQAVLLARQAGGEKLSVLLGQDSVSRDFFTDYGFSPAGDFADGRLLLEKNIAFIPEFLGESGENIDKPDMTSI